MTSILSIQSSVAYGHAGNSAAVFPLMRMGVEVWPVLTVHFSNHTGYGKWRGPLLAAADIGEVITGIDERGVLTGCDALLSGYLGAADVGAEVLKAAALLKERNPQAIWCCDPVMGDVRRGFFVRPGIPEFLRDTVVPAADVITPNLFELEFLSGHTVTDVDSLLAAVDVVRETGPRTVLVTSAILPDSTEQTLDLVVVTDDGAWAVTTPLLALQISGCGDITSATFLAHLLAGLAPPSAVEKTAASVFGVLEQTVAAQSYELKLVQAQDEFVSPRHTFVSRRLR